MKCMRLSESVIPVYIGVIFDVVLNKTVIIKLNTFIYLIYQKNLSLYQGSSHFINKDTLCNFILIIKQ